MSTVARIGRAYVKRLWQKGPMGGFLMFIGHLMGDASIVALGEGLWALSLLCALVMEVFEDMRVSAWKKSRRTPVEDSPAW